MPLASEADGRTAVEAASERLQDWLCFGPAVVSEGVHAGAVAGCIATDGLPEYAYPEIAGYFLTWLAFLERTGSLQAPSHALVPAIGAWHTRWLAAGAQTRVRLRPDGEDEWRNRAIFLFDLAMLLRGVAQASDCGLMDRTIAAPLALSLSDAILALRDDRGLLNCLRARDGAVPDRWSTRRGPFLTKALVAILLADDSMRLPEELTDAASATLGEIWPAASIEVHPESAHAAMYFVEGVLMADGYGFPDDTFVRAARVARRIDPCQQEAGIAKNALGCRHDVMAQWLRANLLIRADGRGSGGTDSTDAIAHKLAHAVREDGSLAFGSGGLDVRANTWCALFAHQALWLHSNFGARNPPFFSREYLV